MFYQLELEGITRSIAANCQLEKVKQNQITLVLDENQASVFNEEQQRRINAAFNSYFGVKIQLVIEPGTIKGETPHRWRERMDQQRLQEAIKTFENDEMVQEIIDRFGGDIEHDSIEPTSPKQY